MILTFLIKLGLVMVLFAVVFVLFAYAIMIIRDLW